MFENFVLGKIQNENDMVNNFWEAVLSGDKLLKEAVVKSGLSDFTKNYIINDINETIDKDDLLSRIEKSNKLCFNYTIRPKWTLVTFLFNNFESRPPNEIIKKLNSFPFYNYYSDAITDFIKENAQIFITKTEITGIIDKTNKAIYQKLVPDINNIKIKNFFLQIYKLKYDEESYNLESSMPYSFIKIFLEDKSFFDLEKKFRGIKGINDEYEISLKNIIKVLTDKYIMPETGESTPKKIETVKEKEAKILSGEIPVKEKEIKKNESGKDAEVKTNFNSEKSKEEEVRKTPEPEKIYSEQLLKANKEGTAAKRETTAVLESYDIKDLFNERLLEKISDKIYNSDLIYRERSFHKLNHYKTWFEASNHLKEIFKINGVDLYNKDVIVFIDILNDFYKNRE